METKSGKLRINVGAATMADENVVEPLSPRSAMFAHSDSTYIVAIMGFDSPINIDIFRKKLSIAIVDNPRFSSLLVVDEKKNNELGWVHIPNMNIDEHIIVPTNKADNSLSTNKYVEEYLHSLTKTSMDASKPLWDLHLLNVKTTEAESIGIFRFHHALGDGTSLISLVLSCSRQTSDHSTLRVIPTMKKKEMIVKISYCGFWKLPWSFVLMIWWWLQVFWNTIMGVSRCLATTFFLKDSNELIIESPNDKNKPRRIVYKIISLDDMKLVKNAMNVTINDVALGMTQAGFTRFVNRRISNDEKDDESKTNRFLENQRLTITMAVNVRVVKGVQSLANMKKKDSNVRWGNEIGFVLLPLSIQLRDDPLEYVRKAKAANDKMKQSFEAQCNLKINQVANNLFGTKVASSFWLNYSSNVSVLFSNVPGPFEEIDFCGHPLKFIAPSLYAIPTPVIVHFQSYVNKMTIAVSVREDAIIDPHQLSEDIAQSLTLLKNATKN